MEAVAFREMPKRLISSAVSKPKNNLYPRMISDGTDNRSPVKTANKSKPQINWAEDVSASEGLQAEKRPGCNAS